MKAYETMRSSLSHEARSRALKFRALPGATDEEKGWATALSILAEQIDQLELNLEMKA